MESDKVGSVYANKYVWIFSLAFAAVTAAMYVNLTYGPAYAYTVLPEGIAAAIAGAFGWIAFPAAIAGGVVVWKTGKCSKAILAGAVITSLCILIPLAGPTGSAPVIAAAYGIAGWGPLFCGVPAITLLVKAAGKLYPAERIGSVMGIMTFLGFGLSIVSTQVSAALVAHGWAPVFAVAMVFGLVAIAAGAGSIAGERRIK